MLFSLSSRFYHGNENFQLTDGKTIFCTLKQQWEVGYEVNLNKSMIEIFAAMQSRTYFRRVGVMFEFKIVRRKTQMIEAIV